MKKQLPSTTPHIRSLSIGAGAALLALLVAWTGCAELGGRSGRGGAAEAGTVGGASIANPASVNCVEQGGTLAILKRGDGGEYGICTFADGRQCEEWALMRGECPAGGVPVTGLATTEARYCAVTGGRYTESRDDHGRWKRGRCTFPDGRTCDAGEYYEGKCARYP